MCYHCTTVVPVMTVEKELVCKLFFCMAIDTTDMQPGHTRFTCFENEVSLEATTLLTNWHAQWSMSETSNLIG